MPGICTGAILKGPGVTASAPRPRRHVRLWSTTTQPIYPSREPWCRTSIARTTPTSTTSMKMPQASAASRPGSPRQQARLLGMARWQRAQQRAQPLVPPPPQPAAMSWHRASIKPPGDTASGAADLAQGPSQAPGGPRASNGNALMQPQAPHDRHPPQAPQMQAAMTEKALQQRPQEMQQMPAVRGSATIFLMSGKWCYYNSSIVRL